MHHGGHWLREKIEASGKLKNEFAKLIGSNGNTLRGWFNQELPRPKRAYRVNMAKLLGMSEEQLDLGLNGVGKAPPKTSIKHSREQMPETPAELRSIPVLSSISATAFNDHTGDDGGVGHVSVPIDSSNAFALKVDGDCMSPRYENGEIVVFKPIEDYRQIENGRDYAVQYDADRAGESTFKRLTIDKKKPGVAIAHCINPATKPGAFQIDLRHVARISVAVLTVHKSGN